MSGRIEASRSISNDDSGGLRELATGTERSNVCPRVAALTYGENEDDDGECEMRSRQPKAWAAFEWVFRFEQNIRGTQCESGYRRTKSSSSKYDPENRHDEPARQEARTSDVARGVRASQGEEKQRKLQNTRKGKQAAPSV